MSQTMPPSSTLPPTNATNTDATTTIFTIAIIAQFVICSIGCLLNSFLAYVIAKNQNLRQNSCGVLIMLLAIFDAIAEFSLISTPTYLYLTGTQIPLLPCFFAQFYATFAQVNAQNLMLFISVDRLLSVLSPIQYIFISKNYKKRLLGITVPMISILTFIYNLNITYKEPMNNPNKMVFCTTDDMIVGIDKEIYLWVNITQISSTFLFYMLIWMLLKCNVVKKMQNDSDRRVFKSLFILMALMFFCYLPPQLCGSFVFPNLPIGKTSQTALYRLSRQIMKLAQTLNIAVLYFCSIDYRTAIRKELYGWCRIQQQTQTQSLIMVKSKNSTPKY